MAGHPVEPREEAPHPLEVALARAEEAHRPVLMTMKPDHQRASVSGASIVGIQIGSIQKRLLESGIHLEVTRPAVERLAKLGYDPQFGARPLKRVLQREILNELSKQILAGKVNKDSVIQVTMKNDVDFEFINAEEVEAE